MIHRDTGPPPPMGCASKADTETHVLFVQGTAQLTGAQTGALVMCINHQAGPEMTQPCAGAGPTP